MARNKVSMTGDLFLDYARKLEDLGGNIKDTVDKALEKSAKYVNENLEKDIKIHRRTGKTEKSLRENEQKVEWEGTVASVPVGFSIRKGGLPSIFLMYGTPKHGPVGKRPGATGHPGTKQDKKLYNDVYGAATKRKVQEIQEKVFAEDIEKIMNK